MRFLLDTHAFLWWLADSARLSDRARDLIANPAHHRFVSAASAWEIATKHRLGKLRVTDQGTLDTLGMIRSQGFRELPISVQDAERAGSLKGVHRDPFDRMLVAQAVRHSMVLISRDNALDAFEVHRVW